MMLKKTICVLLLALLLPVCAAWAEETGMMPEPFASAEFNDPAVIPYPENRDENGYLTEGEFVYQNPDQGLWAYLSPTLQVEIIRYDGVVDGYPQRWFTANLKYDTSAELFALREWYQKAENGEVLRGNMPRQEIWVKTLAQNERAVLAISSDYYIRRYKDQTTGNIVRGGKMVRDVTKTLSWPFLENAAFFDDGTMAVYDAKETTGTDLAAQGARDVVSFGPWLVRDGVLRTEFPDAEQGSKRYGYVYEDCAPRMGIGMLEPGHYVIVMAEGLLEDAGARGLTVVQLGQLLYGYGALQAYNLDGGNTAVMIFMGEQLNRNGGGGSKQVSARHEEELFCIGYSDQVSTDWINGDPKK